MFTIWFSAKLASNGVFLVALSGVRHLISITLADLLLSISLLQLGINKIANCLLFVWIRRSTMPVPLWSPARAKISFIICFFRKFQTIWLSDWAWSHLIDRDISCSMQYFSRWWIAVSVSQMWKVSAWGYRNKRSTVARIELFWLFSWNGIEPAKSIWISLMASTIFGIVFWGWKCLNFYLCWCSVCMT